MAALKEQVKTLQWANAELVATNKLLAENAAVDKEVIKNLSITLANQSASFVSDGGKPAK